MNRSSATKMLFGFFLIMILVSCNRNDSLSVNSRGKTYYEYFDTVSYVYSYANDSEQDFEQRAAMVATTLEKYHKLLDIYHEYSGINNLCTVNNNAGGDPVDVDPLLIEFLDYAKEMYNLTQGRMNIAMGSVLRLWHDSRLAQTHYVPSQEALRDAAQYISIENLEIDHRNCTVRLRDKNCSLDVGALGKGWAAEKASQLLEANGVSSYVLNIGGNVRTIGAKSDGSPWKIGIKDPTNPEGQFALTLALKDCSCVTSGTYERFFTVDGVRYHHIIDVDSLMPATYFESVTVISKDSALADSLSTALFCMPYSQGKALVKGLEGVDCIWIFSNGDIVYTSGIEDLIFE